MPTSNNELTNATAATIKMSKKLNPFAHEMLWNLSYNLKPQNWTSLVPLSQICDQMGNPYGVMTTLTRDMLETAFEVELMIADENYPNEFDVHKMIDLIKGTRKYQQRHLKNVDDILLLHSRLGERLSNKSIAPWSLCGHFFREIIALLSVASFRTLITILTEEDEIICKRSESHILPMFSNYLRITESGLNDENLKDRIEDAVSNEPPLQAVIQLLKYLQFKDEMGVERCIHRYYDSMTSISKFKNRHHQGIIGLSIAEMHLGRYEQSMISLNEALSRRRTANSMLNKYRYNQFSNSTFSIVLEHSN